MKKARKPVNVETVIYTQYILENEERIKREENNNFDKRGITLIALVVTIVILIILSAITINLIFNDNSIIDKTEKLANNINNLLNNTTEKLGNLMDELSESGTNQNTPDPEEQEIKITGLTFANDNATEVNVGETITLKVNVEPENASNKVLKWTSSDLNIATVSNIGIVTGIKRGEITITVEATDGSGVNVQTTIAVKSTKTTVADLINKPADTTQNIEAEDEYGNKITIPEGFIIVPDTTDNDVSYNYTGSTTPDGLKVPSVQDGIVIEHQTDGNQFVWIPVGNIKNIDESTTTIDLARYTFDVGTYDNTTKTYDGAGTITKKVLEIDGNLGIIPDYTEKTSLGNSLAKDIEGFKTSANSKGGYYLARYEASQNGEKAMSKANQNVWNNITQVNASTASEKMYTSTNFKSDLINSYSWDTAIVFIQTYGGEENKTYSKKTSKNTSLNKTGVSGDKTCNIYDMASNIGEWTTETCVHAAAPCTYRAGYYAYAKGYTSKRSYRTNTESEYIAFRVILYVN